MHASCVCLYAWLEIGIDYFPCFGIEFVVIAQKSTTSSSVHRMMYVGWLSSLTIAEIPTTVTSIGWVTVRLTRTNNIYDFPLQKMSENIYILINLRLPGCSLLLP